MSQNQSITSVRHADGKLRYFFIRTCDTCGETQRVPKASKAPNPTCKRCTDAGRRGVAVPARMTGEMVQCLQCNAAIYKRPSERSRQFCSRACAANHKRRYAKTMKTCGHCGKAFLYSPKPASNTPGTYCSLKCRNAGYLGKFHGKPARNVRTNRPGWASVSRRFRANDNQFCSRCGATGGRLAVHHVDPYWRSKNNDPQNLVTLCPPCHGKMEMLSEKLATLPSQKREAAVAIIQARLHDLWHIHQGRRMLKIQK